MKIRTKIIIVITALTVSFAAGRYSVSVKKTEETKTVAVKVETENKQKDVKKRKKTHVVKTEVIKPDGSKTVTTVVDHDTNVDSKDTTVTQETEHKTSDEKTTVVKGDQKLTISALAGVDFTGNKMVFGAALTKPVLGPITLGIFGLSNNTVGGSVGLSF